MRNVRRRYRWLVSFAALPLVLSACGGGSGSSAGSESSGRRAEITVAVVGVPITPTYNVAQFAAEMGIFEKHDLDVKIIQQKTANQPISSLVSGDANIAITGESNVLAAITQGVDLRVYMFPATTQRFVLAAANEITSYQDLAGKTMVQVGISNTNVDYATAVAALEGNGIDPGNLEFLATGGNSSRISVVISGKAQATVTTPEEYVAASAASEDIQILDHAPQENFPYSVGNSVSATQDWVNDNPEAMKAFLASMVEAGRQMTESKDDFVEIGGRLNPELTPDMLSELWEQMIDINYWSLNGGIQEDKIDGLIDYYYTVQETELANSPSRVDDLQGLVDTSILSRVLDELGTVPSEADSADGWYEK